MATKPVGLPKTGGREKGTVNKKTADLLEKCEELGCDPFEVLLHFTKGDWESLGYEKPTVTKYTKDGSTWEEDVIPPELRMNAAKEACKYIYPQRKAVEHTSEQGLLIRLEDYLEKK